MKLKKTRTEFLSNKENKQHFIEELVRFLQSNDIDARQGDGDVDVEVAQKAVTIAQQTPTVVIGEDTDLLVLLIATSGKT